MTPLQILTDGMLYSNLRSIQYIPLNSRSAADFPTSAPSLVLAKSNG